MENPYGVRLWRRRTNDSRHDQLLSAGHSDHGPQGVEKHVANPACLSLQRAAFLLQSRCDRALPDTSEAPGNLLAPRAAVRTEALIGYVRVSTTGQLLERQQHAGAEADCLRVFAGKLSGKNAGRSRSGTCRPRIFSARAAVSYSIRHNACPAAGRPGLAHNRTAAGDSELSRGTGNSGPVSTAMESGFLNGPDVLWHGCAVGASGTALAFPTAATSPSYASTAPGTSASDGSGLVFASSAPGDAAS